MRVLNVWVCVCVCSCVHSVIYVCMYVCMYVCIGNWALFEGIDASIVKSATLAPLKGIPYCM